MARACSTCNFDSRDMSLGPWVSQCASYGGRFKKKSLQLSFWLVLARKPTESSKFDAGEFFKKVGSLNTIIFKTVPNIVPVA